MSKFCDRLFSKEFFKKDVTVSIVIALIFSIILNLVGFDTKCERIRNNVLRLHILANSNSEEDQKMKLEIRDCLLLASNGILDGAKNKEDAILAANEKLSTFEDIAQKVVKSYGKDYPIKIEISKTYFDTREYEDFTLPAGQYEALRILIGKAEGKNWWCIMFPSLCIPAAKSKNSLEEVTDKSASNITKNYKKYKVKFKIVEVYEKFKNR